jgi:hypothetical protein
MISVCSLRLISRGVQHFLVAIFSSNAGNAPPQFYSGKTKALERSRMEEKEKEFLQTLESGSSSFEFHSAGFTL